VSYRPLAFVFGLTLGDYLLWNWSLNANHDVLALVSGLTLPPLALACAWILALTVIRLIGSSTRRSRRGAAMAAADADRKRDISEAALRARTPPGRDGSPASPGSPPPSSGKLAA
jgi:hypothetical protein